MVRYETLSSCASLINCVTYDVRGHMASRTVCACVWLACPSSDD